MQCPTCKSKISDKEPVCKTCGYDVRLMDEVLAHCPVCRGHMNDLAGVLSPGDVEALEKRLADYKVQSGRDVVVVTVQNTKPLSPAQYVFWLYNEWGVGGKKHNGVMILLALDERRVETEVGFGLEHIVTDKRSGEILDQAMLPQLKAGHFADGLRAGVDTLMHALNEKA